MEYSWQGSDKRKLSLIQDLFKSESESTEEGNAEETEETQDEVVMEEEVVEPEPEPILEEVPVAAPSKPKKKKTT